MLRLGRKPGERIFIGDNVVVTIVQVRGDRVTVGIDAPKNVSIRRDDYEPKGDEQCPSQP